MSSYHPKKQKIVTIGGGTGSFTILAGLKNYPVELSAIVSMADDGGSTGILRDELGVLPPGDVRQCLVALSGSSQTLRELFNYRYGRGKLQGHSFGNLFLSTLEKITGDFNSAMEEAGRILAVSGRVIPVTLSNTKLIAELKNGKKIIGESRVDKSNLANLKKLTLRPMAMASPAAIRAIKRADKIIISPGNLFCSIIPNLLVRGIAKAIKAAKAKKIYVCNLMNKAGHTHNFNVIDYVKTLESYLGISVLDFVIYNQQKPAQGLIKKYAKRGDGFVEKGDLKQCPKIKFLGYHLLSKKIHQQTPGDKIERILVRHDSGKIAKIIYHL